MTISASAVRMGDAVEPSDVLTRIEVVWMSVSSLKVDLRGIRRPRGDRVDGRVVSSC